MASVNPRVISKSLDEYVDQALLSEKSSSDWLFVAQRLAERVGNVTPRVAPVESGDPYQRMYRSDVGQRLYGRVQNEGRSLAELGLLAIQPLLEPERLDGIIAQVLGRRPDPHSRRLIVYHGNGGAERSVLILDPTRPQELPPTVIPPSLYAPLLEQPTAGALERINRLQPQLIDRSHLIHEAAWITRPQVVVGSAPPMEKVSVPVPPWKMESGPELSTVGILARSAQGVVGVTACFHGAGPPGTKVRLYDGTDFVEGTVTLADQTLDICFVPVGDNWRPARVVGSGGVLINRAPGKSEAHSFTGFQEPAPKMTEIVAVDWGVPFYVPQRQLCVQTKADTNRGDSGSALVNGDDRVVGFAFQRTPFGGAATLEFADWIWAHSALTELKLTPL